MGSLAAATSVSNSCLVEPLKSGLGLRHQRVKRIRLHSNLWGQHIEQSCRSLRFTARCKPFRVAALDEKSSEPRRPSSSVLESKGTDQGLASQSLSGELTATSSRRDDKFSGLLRILAAFRKILANALRKILCSALANLDRSLEQEKLPKMPEATGDLRRIVGQPFFLLFYTLFRTYGGVYRLKFGPKSFIIVSDPHVAKRILKDNSKAYSKGVLAEILEFVMGNGLISSDGEIWRLRRRAIVPSLHQKFVTAMLRVFGDCTNRLCDKLYATAGEDVEMENLFSRLTLDVIGKAVFNYDFDSLSNDTGIVDAVYVTLRECEDRSFGFIPYWKVPILAAIDPRQRRVANALKLVNETLDSLIAKCKQIVDEEDDEFTDEYVSQRDPCILHFLLASGDEVSSKQLRDDLVTLLIAGHETSAAVLTWTFYLLTLNPDVTAKLQKEADTVLGDLAPTIDDLGKLQFTANVISEALRLYPQPPVLVRRASEDDMLGQYSLRAGEDLFISVWNLHRSPDLWDNPDEFRPERWETYSTAAASQAFRYIPFGGGPRKCVGDLFATCELVTALAMLARRFNFELTAGAPPVLMTTGATIHTTNGLHMTFTRRTTAPVAREPSFTV